MTLSRQGIIITQTPSRISFFGGGTDFPDYFNQFGGTVIGAAIDKYVYVTINSLERFFEKRIRLSYSKHEFVDRPEELEHPVVRCILQTHTHFDDRDFLDIHTFADLPAASGIGSSSSFSVGMLNALYLLRGIYKTPESIAKEAIWIEREKLKEAGGWQDQILAAYGGLTRVHFSNHGFRVEPVCIPIDKKQALQDSLIMVFIGGVRSSAQIQETAMDLKDRMKIGYLQQIQAYAQEAFEMLTSDLASDELIKEFGALLNRAWLAKRQLSKNISSQTIDQLYERALQVGALGGKLCGAGGGGFLLLVVPQEKRLAVQQAFEGYKCLDLKFEDHGSKVIYSKGSDKL